MGEQRERHPFATAVRDARERGGLKQREVAEKIGTTSSYVAMIEAGKLPAGALVPRLAVALNVEFSVLARLHDQERVLDLAAGLHDSALRERVRASLRSAEGTGVRRSACPATEEMQGVCDRYLALDAGARRLVNELLERLLGT